jgi:hypothetical protein
LAQQAFDIEHNFMTQAEVLISGGEGLTTEFKQQLPGTDPRTAMKTIAAFANKDGGVLRASFCSRWPLG